MGASFSGKSVPEFFGPIAIDVDKAGQLARRIKMLKKENRLIPIQQQTNQPLKTNAGIPGTATSKSKLEDFNFGLKVDELVEICGLAERPSKKLEEEPPRGRAKLEELVEICGLAEKPSKKLEEEPPRGRAKELPEEEKALMVEQNPGNRLILFSSFFFCCLHHAL